MKKVLCMLVIAITFALAGCGALTDPGYPSPIDFESTDAIKAEKDRRNATSYQENDPQNIKGVSTCYQFSKLPVDIVLSRYTVSKAYVSASYVYRKGVGDYTSQFSELAYPDDEVLNISLTAHRDYGQKEFDEFLERNTDNGKIISSEGIPVIFYQEAIYNGAVLQKVYYFVTMSQYLSLSVPGNLPDEIVDELLKDIDKIDIS
jgi:hypothetical protein